MRSFAIWAGHCISDSVGETEIEHRIFIVELRGKARFSSFKRIYENNIKMNPRTEVGWHWLRTVSIFRSWYFGVEGTVYLTGSYAFNLTLPVSRQRL